MATSKTKEGQGIITRLWEKHHGETMFAMYTPFVLSLASGNLEKNSFSHFIAQDIRFLEAYAHASELAEKCSDDDDAKRLLSKMKKGSAIEELLTFQEWGFSKETYPMTSVTKKYMDFLLATASGKIEGVETPLEGTKVGAYTLCSMMPCLQLYPFLGKELQALLDPNDVNHPYKKWIDRYSSDAFLKDMLRVVNKLIDTYTDMEINIIEKLYAEAMKLEIEFFLAQPVNQPTVVPLVKLQHHPLKDHLLIFCDFDQTCTEEAVDSFTILAEVANLVAPKLDQAKPDNEFTSTPVTELRSKWDVLVGQYMKEYEQCIASIISSEKADLNYEALNEALEKLSDVQRKGNSQVNESRIFKGLSLEKIIRAGERLPMRDGCTRFLQKLLKNENLSACVHIISLSWCGDLIRSAFSSGGLHALNVYANEFVYEDSISTGDIVRNIESPADKAQTFINILKSYGEDKNNLTVYIGDSIIDLLCLLQADIGIVIGSNSVLRRVGSQFGVTFVPLYSALVKKQKENSYNWKELSGILYTVSSWAEIDAFILGWY